MERDRSKLFRLNKEIKDKQKVIHKREQQAAVY